MKAKRKKEPLVRVMFADPMFIPGSTLFEKQRSFSLYVKASGHAAEPFAIFDLSRFEEAVEVLAQHINRGATGSRFRQFFMAQDRKTARSYLQALGLTPPHRALLAQQEDRG